jgi:predicted O-methyltransferase YrrM
MKTIEELLNEKRMGPDSRDMRKNYVRGLYDLIKDFLNKDTEMAEIGCYRGVSTELFAKHCKKIYAIDPWDLVCDGKYVNVTRAKRKLPKQIDAMNNFLNMASDYDNIVPIKGFSYEVTDQFADESLDFVYVDGHHSYRACLEDVKMWLPKVKVGGTIAGHDYHLSEINRVVKMITKVIPERKRYKDESWAFVKPKKGIEREI